MVMAHHYDDVVPKQPVKMHIVKDLPYVEVVFAALIVAIKEID